MEFFMGQFLDSIKAVKENYKPYDAWEQAQADERAKKEYLSKSLDIPKDKIELTAGKSQSVIRATEILDRYSEDNCENMEQATNTVAGFVTMPVLMLSQLATNKMMAKHPFQALAINSFIALGVGASLILWGNSMQKEASRIGRFQAMQKDLKDVNNFVVYTPEQIQEAKEKAATITLDKEQNGFLKIFSELKTLQKDKNAYKEWVKTKDKNEIENLKNRQLTAEQIKLGNEDKELIVDTVKEINIKAEEYSENLENAYDTLGTLSWLFAIPVGWMINSALKFANVNANRTAISMIVPVITGLAISMQGTVAQKEASRVGRFVARKDLSENPARLMAYSDEDMQKAKDIKAPEQKKTVLEKISESFVFLKKYYNDNKEYKEYRKTVHDEQERMQKALKDVKISDEQRRDAENLQKKVFLAFGEIDEMSQRYSEDIEAGSEIAKNAINEVWGFASAGSMVLAGMAVMKGNFPVTKIVNTVVNLGLKQESTLRIAINDFYKALKDNNLVKDFQKSIIKGKVREFSHLPEAQNIAPVFKKLANEFISLATPDVIRNPENLSNVLAPHLKDGMIAKWVRNLMSQTGKFYLLNKLNLPKGDISEYKTLIGTIAVAGAPILGVMFSIPYIVNAFFTDLQKKAGKIGIMKAMEKIDDPRVFADTNDKNNVVQQGNALLENNQIKQKNNIFSDFQKLTTVS